MFKILSLLNPFYVKWEQPPNVQKHARYFSARILSEFSSTFGSANESVKVQVLVWAPTIFFGRLRLFRLPSQLAAVRVSSNGYESYLIDPRFKHQDQVLRAMRLELTYVITSLKNNDE